MIKFGNEKTYAKKIPITPQAIELENLFLNLRQLYKNILIPNCIEVGDYTYGMLNIFKINNDTNFFMGKFCSIANDVKIYLGGEHRSDWITTYPFNDLVPSYSYIEGHPATKGDIIIGNDVWLCSDSKILSGVTISDGAVVASGAVVTRNIGPYEIHGGVPAKLIKKRFNDQIINKLLEIKWWNWPINALADAIPLLQSSDFDSLFAFYDKLHAEGIF